jgi:excisionase family DNA binding protein
MKTIQDIAPLLVDISSLSAAIGVSISTIRRMQAAGRIPHIKVGGKLVRFSPQDVIAAFNHSEINPGPASPTRGIKRNCGTDLNEQ